MLKNSQNFNFFNFNVFKVVLIFGLVGSCSCDELRKIQETDITKTESLWKVTIRETKSGVPNAFLIEGAFLETVKKYDGLRPAGTNQFFMNLQNGKCTRQAIGKNKFGSMPKEIATFLQLPDPASYTGHGFRRTSATLTADAITLKRQAKFQKSKEGYKAPIGSNSVEPSTKRLKIEEHFLLPSTSKDKL